MVKITLNGEQKEIPDTLTAAGLLEHLGIPAAHVVVEVNMDVLPSETLEQQGLHEGDSVELIKFVGGG